jgi:UrcA family protein
MTRIHPGVIGAAAAMALIAGAAKAQTYRADYTTGEVTVYAPRIYHQQLRPGSPEEIVRESLVVPAGDLNLATRWGARTLWRRIDFAARRACADLDDRYMAVDSPSDCVQVATRDAMFDVEDRLGFAPPTWP